MRVRFVGDEPGVPEAAHLLDDREERLTLVGQLVLGPPGGGALLDDVVLLEEAEAFRERPRADPGAGTLELGEPPRPFREVVEDDRRPFRADDVGRAGNRALLVVNGPHRAHGLIVALAVSSPMAVARAPIGRRASWTRRGSPRVRRRGSRWGRDRARRGLPGTRGEAFRGGARPDSARQVPRRSRGGPARSSLPARGARPGARRSCV